ncbi:ABC transporter ATP-binding protein [Nitratireductor sp. CH_MIT9313-5]|uniref:ABC transporter ATP-binding protein n=1 Tax=Nitratireductor sp. CH_MIT9313-5 TaxID=3107764 RepID=UPI00300AA9A9
MLEVRNLNVVRGATHVLKDVSLTVREGELTALIGANGAGKSTTLLTLSGLLRPKSGEIRFTADGSELDLARASSEKIVRHGLIHCPEGRQIFQSLTVAENLEMGAYTRKDPGQVKKDMERVLTLFPILAERSDIPAGSMSGGEQMMLAIGRALLAKPKMLLLDEPSLGLAPQIVETIFDVIEQLKETGVTILLIEQNAAMALDIADQAHVLENGRIVLSGSGAELAANDRVRQSYLGGAA